MYQELSYTYQFIITVAQPDFFSMSQTRFIFRVRIGIVEMVMMVMKMRTCHFIRQLAIGQRSLFQPTSGIIGVSLPEWQSQVGETSHTKEIWKFGLP